jgi:hypothetical protein
MAVKFSDFASTSLNSTGFIVGYDSGTNLNIRIPKSTLDSTYQSTLVSGTNIKTINSTSLLGSGNVAVQPTLVSATNIKTINGASVLGSGDLVVSGSQVGYRGFRYNISSTQDQYAIPVSGQALVYIYVDGESGDAYYQGLNISRTNADGVDMSSILEYLNFQAVTLTTSTGTYVIYPNGGNVTTFAGYVQILSSSTPSGTAGLAPSGLCYLDFGTSNKVNFLGTPMMGNLNGTAVPSGTYYIGIGSSTAGTTENSRSTLMFGVGAPTVYLPYLNLAATVPNTMTIALVVNGTASATPTIIPSGSAAGLITLQPSYTLVPSPISGGGQAISIRISGLGGYTINQFGWTLRP